MKSMKRFIYAGIVVLLAMFVVTCEADLPEVAKDIDGFIAVSEDVMVSEDGSQIRVYLDGEKAPRTASRAMFSGLAQMYFDYFEVIFVGGTTVARTNWELGYPAGISGVARNGTTGYTYGPVPTGTTPAAPYAAMFVGKKEGKTLLGVGKIIMVDGTAGAFVDTSSKSVTFLISPVLTGLTVAASAPGATATEATVMADPKTTPNTHPRGVLYSSFSYAAGGSAGSTYETIGTGNSSLVTFSTGGVAYPQYSLPTTLNATVNAEYQFNFYANAVAPLMSVNDCLFAIKHCPTTGTPTALLGSPEVKKRTPRFMESGAYKEPRSFVDAKSTVALRGYTATSGGDFNPIVPLQFTTKGSGIFSFYIQIPVYMANSAASTTTPIGTAAEKWYIRTGIGSELYSLDDGASSGGCVLMSVGMGGSDWLNIEWQWL